MQLEKKVLSFAKVLKERKSSQKEIFSKGNLLKRKSNRKGPSINYVVSVGASLSGGGGRGVKNLQFYLVNDD